MIVDCWLFSQLFSFFKIANKLLEIISEEGFSGLNKAVQIIINQAMLIERDRHLKAAHYAITPPSLKDFALYPNPKWGGFKTHLIKNVVDDAAPVKSHQEIPTTGDKGL